MPEPLPKEGGKGRRRGFNYVQRPWLTPNLQSPTGPLSQVLAFGERLSVRRGGNLWAKNGHAWAEKRRSLK